jgi:hypothetical protein
MNRIIYIKKYFLLKFLSKEINYLKIFLFFFLEF